MIEYDISVKEMSLATGQREKTVHYAKELAKKYPDINSVPDGKNVSWYKITKTLPDREKDKTKKGKQAPDK